MNLQFSKPGKLFIFTTLLQEVAPSYFIKRKLVHCEINDQRNFNNLIADQDLKTNINFSFLACGK